jgi:putative specificity protein s
MSWASVTLGEVSTNIQTGPFGSQLHQSDYSDGGVPVVMPKDLVDGHISEDSIARVSMNHVDRLSRHKIEVGDILYSRRGDVGRCAFATEVEQGWLCGTGCLRVTIDQSKAIPKFIFYQLQKAETIGWVEKHAVGSTMLNLNTSILGSVPIELPSMAEQQMIVHVLSAYDDLIENNQKQIKLLEEAAQRLYKEWFVDLRFPGHETTPIVDGIPEGWENASVTDLLEIRYGKDHKGLADGCIPVYGSGGIMRKVDKILYSGESVLIPRKGSLNNILLVSGDFWTIDTMFYSVPKRPNVAKYVYLYLTGIDMYAMNIGAAVPSMSVKILDGMRLLCPSDSILELFETTAKPYYEMIELLKKKQSMLGETRDRLLLKLMSGEIEV